MVIRITFMSRAELPAYEKYDKCMDFKEKKKIGNKD